MEGYGSRDGNGSGKVRVRRLPTGKHIHGFSLCPPTSVPAGKKSCQCPRPMDIRGYWATHHPPCTPAPPVVAPSYAAAPPASPPAQMSSRPPATACRHRPHVLPGVAPFYVAVLLAASSRTSADAAAPSCRYLPPTSCAAAPRSCVASGEPPRAHECEGVVRALVPVRE